MKTVTNMPAEFQFTFWGTRGSFPVPGKHTVRYGGNTPCVEVRMGDRRLILDAGTGLIPLGATEPRGEFDLLLSHSHIDHMIGLPFFAPAYVPENHIHIWAGHLLPEWNTRKIISHMMTPPLFPLTVEDFKAKLSFHDFTAKDELSDSRFAGDGIRITTHPLSHPDRATAYRISQQGRSLCYVTDVEHGADQLDEGLVHFLSGADWLIYDSTYDDRDFAKYVGWGHSTWQQAVRLCNRAGVKHLAAFHHDPMATDDLLDARQSELQSQFGNGIIAREGLTISV